MKMLRRSILAATPALLIPKPGLTRHLFGGGSSSQFTPDGTEITYNTGPPVLHTAWGDFSAQAPPYFAGGGVFYILLNGRRVGMIQNALSAGAQFALAAGVYQLWTDHGGNVYAFINGDNGFAMYYNCGWIASGDTSGRFAPVAGYTLPSPPFTPGYTPSPDGTTITAPTASTVTTQDGVWGIISGNLALNGIPVVWNRSGNNNSYPPPFLDASVVAVNSHGTLFYQRMLDTTWRCMSGLQANPSTGPTSSPVPVNLAMTLVSGTSANVSHTAASGTAIASLQMTLSDGTVTAPLTSEVSFVDDQQGTITVSYVSPNLQTNGNNLPLGSADSVIVQATRNGTSFCLPISVFYT